MFLRLFQNLTPNRARREGFRPAAWLAAAGVLCISTAWGQDVPENSKHIIGATARLTEVESGLTFPARIDTGAQSCSLHIEQF
jgi:hypothetical protein